MAEPELSSQELLEATSRPLVPRGTSPPPTQPLPSEFEKRVVKVKRRFTQERRPKSIKFQQRFRSLLFADTSSELRTKVLHEVRLRLSRVGIETKLVPDRFFAWLLPKNGAVVDDWNDLLHTPMLLSPTRLSGMLNLRRSTADTPAPAGEAIFYIRTFALKMHEMVDILQAMFDEGMGIYSKAHMLWEVLQECDIEMDADANVFVRYCGTSRQRSAYGRHAHDLVSPTPDIKSLFMRVCHDLYPEVVEAAQIDELPDGEVEFQLMHSQDWVRDLREQSMIALFGQETLLNTARGGVGRQAAHHQLDNDQFSALGTTLLTNLALYNQPFLNVDAVNAYARQVQQYANANSATTGTRRYPITDSVRDMLAEMAIPVLVNKYPVMVTIGADLPLEMQQEVKPWYKGGFDSADLSIEILNNLGGCELGYLTSATSYVRTMYDNKQLPFVDLFPWTKKDDQDFDAALGLLRHYLQATKPIIVLTFSQKVSSAALGNFQQAWGAKVHQMIQLLGTLTLSKYDEIPEDNFDDTCCIVIPCIHPGYVQYSTVRQDVTVRLISKAMAVVWLAMDEAIKWSKKGDLTKRQICEKVMQSVDRKVNSGTDFGKTLAELKNELADINLKAAQRKPKQVVDPKQKVATKISAQQEKSPAEIIQKTAAQVEREVHDESEAGRGSRLTVHGATLVIQSSSVRYRRALQQLYMVTDCGLSLGKPQSAERIAQSRKLIGLSLAHLKTQSVGSSDDDLRKWLTKVPAQRLYYFEANSISEQASDIPDLLAVFLDKEVNPDIDNWEGDTEEARQASSELVAWVVSEFVPGSVKAATSFEDNIKDLARNFHALMKKQDTKLANVLTRARKEAADVALLFEGDGSEVTVRPSGSGDKQTALLALKWLGADGDEYELEDFQLPWSCMPIAPGEPRYLYLTQHGLDVQDKNGRSLGTSKVRPVTLPIHNLVNALVQNPLQEELLRLWELHSGLTVDEALFQDPNVVSAPAADSFRSLPASFYNGRSLPFETDKDASRKLAKDKIISEMKKSLPFQPGNAAWLINKFITTKYPEGGEVDLASPASFPDAHSMWTALAAFLQEPRYFHHPHRRHLQVACRLASNPPSGQGRAGENEPGQINGMFVVLMTVLRSTVSQARVQSSKGSQPRKIVLTISQEVVQGTVEDLDEPELEQAQPPGVLGEDEQIVDDSDSDAEFGIAGPSEDVSPGVRERLAKERRALAKGETAGGGSGAGSSSKARKREASGSPEESKGKGKVQRKGKGGRGADDDNDDEEMLV